MPSNLCEVDLCKSPQSVCRIRPQDFDLTKCGVPQVPSNARYLDLLKVYPYSVVLGAAGSGTDVLLDEKKSVDANTDFILYQILPIGTEPPTPASGYLVRFQWPWGRYSSQKLQDVQTFLGTMYTLDQDGVPQGLRIPAGNNIGIGLQNTSNASVNVTLLIIGVSRYYLRAA